MCVQLVCSVCIVLWIGNVRIVGSGVDPAFSSGFYRSGTRSECENALTHRNEFLLLAVKEFWFWESYLSGFAAANFWITPKVWNWGPAGCVNPALQRSSGTFWDCGLYVDSLRFLDLLDLVTGGSAGPAIGSLHSVQHVQPVCVQLVCRVCIVLWIGNVRIVGSGVDPAFSSLFGHGTRSGPVWDQVWMRKCLNS